jgi:NTP pyrophosphatase (non-canonical NTP hydrolase)
MNEVETLAMQYKTANEQNAHCAMVMRLAKPATDILPGLNHNKVELIHAALGLSGETGEVVDIIKKYAINGKLLDVVHLIEEVGDVLWYIQLMCINLNIPMTEILTLNRQKLEKRFPEGYSDKAAAAQADKK